MTSQVNSTKNLRIKTSFSKKLNREHTQIHSMKPALPKPVKDNTRKLQANTPDEHGCKNPEQNISKQNSTAH